MVAITFMQLSAVAVHRDEATAAIRDAFSDVGAWITDVHFFSGVQTVFTFEILSESIGALEAALISAGLSFDDQSRARLASARMPGEIQGTLAVIFARGDPDLRHEVPAVPG